MWTQDLGIEKSVDRSKVPKYRRFQLKRKMCFKNKMLKYLYRRASGTIHNSRQTFKGLFTE